MTGDGARACRSRSTSPTGKAANGQTKFVIGLGEASVTAALHPTSTLSAPRVASAAATLGEGIQPSLIVDFPTLLSLLEGVGLSEDPTISRSSHTCGR